MSGKNIRNILLIVVVVIIFLYPLVKRQFKNQVIPALTNTTGQSQTSINNRVLGASIGKQTKFSDCKVNGNLPDSDCTPGAIFENATTSQICTPGYSKSVRNVPDQIKNKVFAEYGIVSHSPGQYEVDHLISLELGGSNDIANLWPEAAEPRPGFHEKDQVENYLHQKVCDNLISLEQAQNIIASNWTQELSLLNN